MRRLMRSPVTWGLTAMFSMTSLNTYAVLTWLPAILTSAGRSDTYGGVMVALFSAIGLPMGLLAPQMAERMRNPFVLVVASVLCFTGGLPRALSRAGRPDHALGDPHRLRPDHVPTGAHADQPAYPYTCRDPLPCRDSPRESGTPSPAPGHCWSASCIRRPVAGWCRWRSWRRRCCHRCGGLRRLQAPLPRRHLGLTRGRGAVSSQVRTCRFGARLAEWTK